MQGNKEVIVYVITSGSKSARSLQGDTASLKFQKTLIVPAPDGNQTSAIVVWGESMNHYLNEIKK